MLASRAVQVVLTLSVVVIVTWFIGWHRVPRTTFEPGESNARADVEALSRYPAAVEKGRAIYSDNCRQCHGERGEGKSSIPTVLDRVSWNVPPLVQHKWRYGGDPDAILASIRDGRPGGMPTFSSILPEARIRLVAAYVYSLQKAQAANAK